MAFISTRAAKIASGGGTSTGGYMTASKLGDGESYRVAIVSENPLEYFTVWGESDEGQKKPFRFTDEPSEADIKRTRRLQTTHELRGHSSRKAQVRHVVLRLRLFRQQDQSFRGRPKNLDWCLDKLSQDKIATCTPGI